MKVHLDLVALLKAAQQIERNVSISLMYSGLRPAQFRLLDLLDGACEPTVTRLSEAMGVTRATVSVMANEMIRSGVLIMVENPSDRRSSHLRITEIGRNKLNVARSDLSVLREKLSARLSEDLIRSLNAFAAAFTERRGGD